jgi:hypothetical protein
MTTDESQCKTPYQTLADLIYAEHPDRKETLNNGAQLAIEALRQSLSVELSPADAEEIFAIIAAIAADILATPVNSVSEKVNLVFDIHSLAAGAVRGEIDLGDTSKAKDMAALMEEARKHAETHTEDTGDDQTGLYL